jgi:hypothetical protein
MITEEQLPMICSVVLEIKILVRRIETPCGMCIPHVATIAIGHDGIIYMRETIDDLRRSPQDNEIKSVIFHNWAEFKAMDTVNFHPAATIAEWATKEHISLAWLGVKQT